MSRGSRVAGRARRTRIQRLATSIGTMLILVGVGWLGWIGWQYFGTNWLAQQEHGRIIAQVEKSWGESPNQEIVIAKGVTADAIIRIPRFGSDYAVPLLEGTSDIVLAQGYGHFSDSASPGARGNFAVAAHRVTHGEPLRRMPELQVGDTVVVETRDVRYTYVLDTPGSGLVVDFTEGWVIGDLPRNPKKGGVQPTQEAGQRLITLTTCSELFNTDNRLIAFGHLSKSEKVVR